MEEELKNYGKPYSYLSSFRDLAQARKDLLVKAFSDAGLTPIAPEGGYFLIANWTSFGIEDEISGTTDAEKDFNFVDWMAKNIHVLGIPIVFFYNEENRHVGAGGIRFNMIKVMKYKKSFAYDLLNFVSYQRKFV